MKTELKELRKNQLETFDRMASVLGVLAAPVRLQLLHFLSQGPQSVEFLAEKTDQSVANVSMHLRKMQGEGLLKVNAQGKRRIYSLAHESLLHFWEEIQDFSEYLGARLPVEEVLGPVDWERSSRETRGVLKDGKAIILDTRPRDEVGEDQLEGVSGYLHIPASELETSLERLPKRKDILVLCRGRLCALSASSVKLLREKGFRAHRLRESWYSLKLLIGGKT